MVRASNITSISSSTTLSSIFDTYIVTSSSSFTITLPNITADGYNFLLKRTDNTQNIVTIIGTGGQLIDGKTTINLNPRSNVRIDSNNGSWSSVILPAVEDWQLSFHNFSGYETVTSTAWRNGYAKFIYKGSNYYGTNPVIMIICFSLNASSGSKQFSVRLHDLTNTNIISTITATATGNQTTYLLASTTTFTNVPANECVIDIEAQLITAGTPNVRLHNLYIQFS